jgi:hypothetical protein
MVPTIVPETTMDFHPQDWIIIAEALTGFSNDWEEIDPKRSRRADELVEAIANEQGISTPELIRQIDSSWPR